MKNILNFNQFSTNEIFGFLNKKYKYDDLAKETFKNMLNCIEDLKVSVYADYKRSVTFSKSDVHKEEFVKESVPPRVHTLKKMSQSDRHKKVATKVSQSDFKTNYNQFGKTEVVSMKNTSKSRLSSKLLGSFKGASYLLSINGKTFVDTDGNMLVNPKISEIYYNFLTELGNIQDDFKRENLSDEDYATNLDKIKKKYQSQIK
jgi:hypothetical protein